MTIYRDGLSKKYVLFDGWEVSIVKNCDGNAAYAGK